MLTDHIQRALIAAQQGRSVHCERALLQALSAIKNKPLNAIRQALSSVDQIEDQTAHTSSEAQLTDKASAILRELELSAQVKSAEVKSLEDKIKVKRDEVLRHLADFARAEDTLRNLKDSVEGAIQMRRAHQLEIRVSTEGLTYPQLVDIEAQSKRERLATIEGELIELLNEADRILRDDINARLTQIRDVRKRINQSSDLK